MTGDLIVSNGAFKIRYKAPFPYVAGAEEADWIEGTGALTVDAAVLERLDPGLLRRTYPHGYLRSCAHLCYTDLQ